MRERKEAERASVEADTSGLPGYQLKMGRARLHLEHLRLATGDWLEVHSDLIREESDPETGDDLVVVDAPAVRPADTIALIAAECIHNLHAALDQLVFSLSWAHTAGPLPKAIAQGCEFPIYGSRAPTKSQLRKRIGAIDPDAQLLIENCQPHHAGKELHLVEAFGVPATTKAAELAVELADLAAVKTIVLIGDAELRVAVDPTLPQHLGMEAMVAQVLHHLLLLAAEKHPPGDHCVLEERAVEHLALLPIATIT